MEEEEIAGFDEEGVDEVVEEAIEDQNRLIEKRSNKSYLLVLVLLVILVALAAFFIFTPQGKKLNPFSKTTTSQPSSNNNTAKQTSTAEETKKSKYTITDAKKFTSTQGGFTFYYPKAWFSENEITLGAQKELYGFDSFFYFFPDNSSTAQGIDKTLFTIMASQNLRDLRDDGSLANYTKTRIVEGRDGTITPTRIQNTEAFKIIDDQPSSQGGIEYFEGYTFVRTQLRYYRKKDTIFLLGAQAKDKATFETFRPEFEFMFDSFILDETMYNDSYKEPVLSNDDRQRKNNIEQVADILDQYYNDRGEYPLYLTFEGLITKLQQDGYLDHNIEDPAWPSKGYRYGSVCAEGIAYKAGTCYYRVDAMFDDQSQTMLKNDGGIDSSRYEIGSSLGADKDKVQYME